MSNISQIDTNFAVTTSLQLDNARFYTVNDERISLHGVFYENGLYRRLPESVAKTVNDGVYNLHTQTAGGRIRFITDSSYVAIKTVMPDVGRMPHFALTGSAGFDMYVGEDEEYYHSFIPPYDMTDGYEDVAHFGDKALRQITINLPLYSSVSALYVGLESDATLQKSTPYRYEKPIVYYGSSITQGGCASRPGCSYESVVSRALKSDYVNLGFSGSARAEDTIADYISGLEASIFVYDYDYNAPSTEHLESTHERLFLKVRSQNPTLPIILMSRPKINLTDEESLRLCIIKRTFDNAIAAGDKNVYLIEGSELMSLAGNDGTVDGCHPNDLGFRSMAEALISVLKKII